MSLQGLYSDKRILKSLIIMCSLIQLLSTSVTADEAQRFIATGFGFATGDFGDDTTTDLTYIDLTAGYLSKTTYLSINIPFNHYAVSNGDTKTKEQGIGDVVLRGDKELFRNDSDMYLSGTLMVKLPTADKTKGLGSGETDYGGYFSLNKTLSDYNFSIASGLLKISDTADQNYNNSVLYGVGLSKSFGKTQIGASVEGRTPVISGLKSPLELNVNSFYDINSSYSINANAMIGLSEGSPDYGYSIGIIKWF